MPRNIADKYVTKSGRTKDYDRGAFSDDLLAASLFLCWAEDAGAEFAGVTAKEAFGAVCRMLDIDPKPLRQIALGKAD